MDAKQLLIIALQASVVATVFSFGLRASIGDLSYVLHKPGLLVRSLIAIVLIMPVVAVVLIAALSMRPVVEIALLALAISPLPPILPKKGAKAGGGQGYALGLMVILAVLSIALVPLAAQALEVWLHRPVAMRPSVIAGLALKTIVVPLVVGMAVHALWPNVAARLEKPVAMLAGVVLAAATLVLVVFAAPAMWALAGDGTLLGMAIFVFVGFIVGYLLGKPDPEDAIVLSLATAGRHPGIALAIAATNSPDKNFGAAILLYLLVGALVSGVGLALLKRKGRIPAAPVSSTHSRG